MDKIPHSFNKRVEDLYKKSGYLDKYGTSLLITILILFSFFLMGAYYRVQQEIIPIRADWLNQRCNPAVMPFAGMINAPVGTSKISFTSSNFSHCISQILNGVMGDASAPIYYSAKMVSEIFQALQDAINSIRKLFDQLRTDVTNIVTDIFSRVLNMLMPLLHMIIKLKDAFSKTSGVLATLVLFLLGAYQTLKALIGTILEFLIAMLITLAAMMIIMWIFPWTWPTAIVMTAIFIAVAVPTAILTYWFGKILNLTTGSVPKASCFDENTIIMTNEGGKPIKDIQPGDILEDGVRITAVFKSTSEGESMYHLENVVVSGKHQVLLTDGSWISVADHYLSKEIIDYRKPFIYCLSTTSKKIKIDNFIFSDWDELDKGDWVHIQKTAKNYLPENPQKGDIHTFLESGFIGSTEIEMEDGRSVPIKNISVNDKLRFGEAVLGIVEIDVCERTVIRKYNIGSTSIIGGPNIQFVDDDLGNMTTLKMKGKRVASVEKIYHLITDTKFLTINGIKFYDYNGMVETLLEGSYLLFPHF